MSKKEEEIQSSGVVDPQRERLDHEIKPHEMGEVGADGSIHGGVQHPLKRAVQKDGEAMLTATPMSLTAADLAIQMIAVNEVVSLEASKPVGHSRAKVALLW